MNLQQSSTTSIASLKQQLVQLSILAAPVIALSPVRPLCPVRRWRERHLLGSLDLEHALGHAGQQTHLGVGNHGLVVAHGRFTPGPGTRLPNPAPH